MYMDMSITNMLNERYGRLISLGCANFFETWRHYGFEKAREGISQRTYYNYLEMLVAVELVLNPRYGVYEIAPAWVLDK